jgi:23S rRNA (uracil-5-)-methyltransferase RumA
VGRQRLYRKGEILELEITDHAFGGKGISRISTEKGPFTVFVQNAVPGQKVRASVTSCKNRYAECRLVDVLRRAPEEAANAFQEIPGAPYVQVPIDLQHAYKRDTTLDLFRKIGGLEAPEKFYQGFVASPQTWHYRNKMEYSFSAIIRDWASGENVDGFGLGFKRRGTWWSVENLDKDSGLFDAVVEDNLHVLRQWFEATGLPPWHPPKREGFFRFLVVRKSYANNTLLVNLVTSSAGLDLFDLDAFVEKVREIFGKERVAGVLHTLNDDTGERVEARAGSTRVLWGEERITEELHGLQFDISMSSFFQTNPGSAQRLYAEVVAGVEGAGLGPQDVVLDLFCGTGTIGQLLARSLGSQVVGVDIVESAIEDARISAERNGTANVTFHAADVGKFLLEHPGYAGRIAAIVIDPPRAGISPKSLRKVIRLGAPRLVYVSCNPATQARDMEVLASYGYALKSFKLVDQFPHTAHVESVAIFDKTDAHGN